MPLSTGYFSTQPAEPPALFQRLSQDAALMRNPPVGAPPVSGNVMPDVMARQKPPTVQQQPQINGPPTGLDPSVQQNPQGPQGGQGGGNAAQMAQAALLYQLLQGGSGGFLGRLMPGAGFGQQLGGLQQAGQGFGLLQDPSIQALFDPGNVWKTNARYRVAQGQAGQTPVRPGTSQLGIDPTVAQNALTFLQMLLGLG